ncbi:hypothetical protein CEXT_402941 [Caerostris extrusa]|uniref:Uncharacterized protein n=1 Tax=Caerostris extrusa TaxID=172846 RepID=A0AAV4QSE2_CAEEX|nr:hypothetical protein CEXT_402941 [Caerostris extrusa]
MCNRLRELMAVSFALRFAPKLTFAPHYETLLHNGNSSCRVAWITPKNVLLVLRSVWGGMLLQKKEKKGAAVNKSEIPPNVYSCDTMEYLTLGDQFA